MKRIALLLLIPAAAACGSEKNLELDLEGRTEGPDPSASLFGPLAWSHVDLGSGNSVVHDLVWAPDGGLLVTMTTWDAQPPDPPSVRSLSRFEADGQRSWVVKEQGHFGNVGATPDGGVVVARAFADAGQSGAAGLDWYSGEGVLTASWRLEASETTDALQEIDALEVTPDGGVVWLGLTSGELAGELTVAGQVDAQGELLWMVPIEEAGNTHTYDYGLDLLSMSDGGSLALVGVSSDGVSSSYLVRLEADGTEVWRTTMSGGYGRGVEQDATGNLVVAGVFSDSMTAGGFRLDSDELNDLQPFMLEMDADGKVLAALEIEEPEPIAGLEPYVDQMTLAGDFLVVSGRHSSVDPTDLPQGFWLAAYDASGSVVDEAIFPMTTGGPGFGPDRLEVDSTGRLAVGGSFAGEMDLGDGELSSGSGFPMRPFIAVFDPARAAID